MRGALANPGFARIWSGQLVSQIGDKFYAIALAVWIADGRGTPATMAIFLIASVAPGLLMGPVAGALADRWNRKTVMIGADIARALVVAGVAALHAAGLLRVWEVVGAAATISAASAFFNPALAASLPGVVGEDSLAEANSLSQLGSGVTSVLGPACGAMVLGFLGYEAVFVFNAASFLASGLLVALTRFPPRGGGASRHGLARSIGEGIRFARSDSGILSVLAVVALAHLAVGGLSVALPFLARSITGSAAVNLGLLEALLGVGMLAGSIVVSRLAGKMRGRGILAALTLMGAGLCGAGILGAANVAQITPFLACSAAIGASVAAAAAFWTTTLQRSTPDPLRGRVFGLSSTLGNASLPVGMALAGLALGRLRTGAVLGLEGAILVLAAGVLTLASAKRRASPTSAPEAGYRSRRATSETASAQASGEHSAQTRR